MRMQMHHFHGWDLLGLGCCDLVPGLDLARAPMTKPPLLPAG